MDNIQRDMLAEECEDAYYNGREFMGHYVQCPSGSFKAGWDARNKEVKRLREALSLALYYVEGDTMWEGLCVKVEEIIGMPVSSLKVTDRTGN